MNCLFCQIIKGEKESLTIYEDEIVKVFLDAYPDNNGHTLIIPKKHYTNIVDIDEETLNHIMKISKKIYSLLTDKLQPDGIKLIQNNGLPQVIKHYHLHLIPVYKNQNKLMNIKDVYNIIVN
ncbi:MAG: HIT domain-containing protein [bacterium]|nr:HIT domain-containing protein [bacterium]